jgi:hypothetical protein
MKRQKPNLSGKEGRRVDLSIGRHQHVGRKTEGTANTEERDESSGKLVSEKLAPAITWYLYASHVRIEHRLNHSPKQNHSAILRSRSLSCNMYNCSSSWATEYEVASATHAGFWI